jgi:hypothetical protein
VARIRVPRQVLGGWRNLSDGNCEHWPGLAQHLQHGSDGSLTLVGDTSVRPARGRSSALSVFFATSALYGVFVCLHPLKVPF